MPAPRCSANWPYTLGLMTGPGWSARMVTDTCAASAAWAAPDPAMNVVAPANIRPSSRFRLRLSMESPSFELLRENSCYGWHPPAPMPLRVWRDNPGAGRRGLGSLAGRHVADGQTDELAHRVARPIRILGGDGVVDTQMIRHRVTLER